MHCKSAKPARWCRPISDVIDLTGDDGDDDDEPIEISSDDSGSRSSSLAPGDIILFEQDPHRDPYATAVQEYGIRYGEDFPVVSQELSQWARFGAMLACVSARMTESSATMDS